MDFVRRHWPVLLGASLLVVPLAMHLRGSSPGNGNAPATGVAGSPESASDESSAKEGMTWIPAGEFLMGSADDNQLDQWPVHRVATDGFWIDKAPVTNDQFREFVSQTSYITTAERRGSSQVFNTESRTWQQVAGATWKSPTGPDSSLQGKGRHPVVHVSWHDARAYAQWASQRLATEAEYERAARGGLLGQRYAWGNEIAPGDKPMANFWQGRFPFEDRGLDQFSAELSPVGRYPANRYELNDIAGNVWCWTADGYDAEFYQSSPRTNPVADNSLPERVLRGGSYLTPASRLTVATRGHADPEHTSCDVGFRCVQ